MRIYYGVEINFYDSHEVKAGMTERLAQYKPSNQFRRVYGLTAFKIWTVDKVFATKLVGGLRNGDICTDDIISLFATLSEWDRKAYNRFQKWLNREAA